MTICGGSVALSSLVSFSIVSLNRESPSTVVKRNVWWENISMFSFNRVSMKTTACQLREAACLVLRGVCRGRDVYKGIFLRATHTHTRCLEMKKSPTGPERKSFSQLDTCGTLKVWRQGGSTWCLSVATIGLF